MTNESIFYIIGLILGAILGYAIRTLVSKKQTVNIVIQKTEKEGADNEQRKAD